VIAHGRVCTRASAVRESRKCPGRPSCLEKSQKRGPWLYFQTMDFSHVEENFQFALSQILSCSLAGNAKI
jgi:hypothetical protein